GVLCQPIQFPRALDVLARCNDQSGQDQIPPLELRLSPCSVCQERRRLHPMGCAYRGLEGLGLRLARSTRASLPVLRTEKSSSPSTSRMSPAETGVSPPSTTTTPEPLVTCTTSDEPGCLCLGSS